LHGYFAAHASGQPNILRLNYAFVSPYNEPLIFRLKCSHFHAYREKMGIARG
jgi:hypothetical protein